MKNETKIIGYKKVTENQKREAKIQIELLKKLKPMPKQIKDEIKQRKETYDKVYNSNIKCLHCHNRLVPIIYGLIDSDTTEQIKRKEIYFGGCEEVFAKWC